MKKITGQKKCPKCGLLSCRKNGKRNRKQRYRCDKCKHTRGGKASKKVDFNNLYDKFCFSVCTYKQLSEEYLTTKKTIQKWLDNAIFMPKCTYGGKGYLVMDTTYIKGIGGVMIFRLWDIEKNKGENMLWYRVINETKIMYQKGLKQLLECGVEILGITVDGGSGLLGSFGSIKTQMCIFHQKEIIRRNIGKNPKLEAHKELKDLAWGLGKIRKTVWMQWFNDRERRYSDRLKEKNNNGCFKHRKARSCRSSFKRHLKYLFIYEENIGQPKTSNTCEGLFGWLKSKKAIHRGMTIERRKKLINRYINGT